MGNDTTRADDPAGGHDPEALRDAADKMHITKQTDDESTTDPEGDHDEAALHDAAAKMGVEE